MTIITSGLPLLDSALQPANGRIAGEVTARLTTTTGIVTKTPFLGVIKAGEIFGPDGVSPLTLPATTEGEAVRVWEIISGKNRDGNEATATFARVVTIPAVATVAYSDLLDVETPPASGIWVIPPYIQTLIDEVTADAEQVALDRIAVADDRTAVELIPAQVDTAMAAQVGTGGVFDTALDATIDTAQMGLSFAPVQPTTGLVGSNPQYLDSLGSYLYGNTSRFLYRATSENGPWTLVKAFGDGDAITGLRETGDGEIILARSTDGLWKSTGWSVNPLTASWRQILVTNGRVPNYSFDVDPASGWVTCTCYINGDMTNSRYVWLSKNNGTTFTQVFDMASAEPDVDQAHSHMHFTALDPFWNDTSPRIWISYHKTSDDPTAAAAPMKKIKYSDDGGISWVNFSNSGYQPVTAIATPAGMVFGSDEGVVGLYIVRRTATPDEMKYELFYAVRSDLDGIFGWATKSIKGSNGAYHFSVRSSVAGYPARVITTDGYRVAETVKLLPATTSDTVDLVDIVEFKERLLGTYYNTTTGNGNPYKFTANTPPRGVPALAPVGGIEGGVAQALGLASGFNSLAAARGTAVGTNSTAALLGSAIGERSSAGAEGSAFGSNSVAIGNGTAIGQNATTDTGLAVGRASSATGDGSAIGPTSKAGIESVAVGSFSEASGTQSTAVGRLSKTLGQYAVAIGQLAQASSVGAIAIGRNAKSLFNFSVAIGYGVSATALDQFAIGGKHLEIGVSATPSAPAAGRARLSFRTNGSGKIEMIVIFPTGSVQVLSTEP